MLQRGLSGLVVEGWLEERDQAVAVVVVVVVAVVVVAVVCR